MTEKTVAPRKQPIQKRSKARIDNILKSTITLLEKVRVESITTTHIAKAAGIPVASLYQYFPNKQAVIYALFQQWMNWVLKKMDELETAYFLKVPKEVFFEKMLTEVMTKPWQSFHAEHQLNKAMRSTPELEKLEQKHSRKIAGRTAKQVKGYGSSWPEEKLMELGLLLYYTTDVIYNSPSAQSLEGRKQTLEWIGTMMGGLLTNCFDE